MLKMKLNAATTPILTDRELDQIRELIEQRSGILFDSSRERFFSARVHHHLSARNLSGGDGLLRLIRSSNVEYDSLLERLLTQETSFFRYPSVFEALAKRVLPEMHEKKFWANPRTLRIWSAGCSTGEEPYSIAIAIADALMFAEAWNIEILATDISQTALRHAELGVYDQRSLGHLTPKQSEMYFSKNNGKFTIRPRIRKMVSFAPMNLAQSVYVGKLDCIFCMNVLIYFTEERRHFLIQRFHDYLESGGYLLLGHAESVSKVSVKFQTIVYGDCILYRKPAAETAARSAALVEGSL